MMIVAWVVRYNIPPSFCKEKESGVDLDTRDECRKNLRFMDQAGIALCRENGLPIVVFDMSVDGNVKRVVCGESIGTRVHD